MSIWQYSRSQRNPKRAIKAIGGAIDICHTYIPKKNLSEEKSRAIGAQEEPYWEQGMRNNTLLGAIYATKELKEAEELEDAKNTHTHTHIDIYIYMKYHCQRQKRVYILEYTIRGRKTYIHIYTYIYI